MRLRILALLLTALSAADVFGISRVGNGSFGSQALGYTIQGPAEFPMSQQTGPESLRFFTLVQPVSMSGYEASTVDLRSWASEFPEWKDLSRQDLAQTLEREGWVRTSQAGIDTYENPKNISRVVFLVWGPGRGIILIAARNERTNAAIDQMKGSLRLLRGTATWK